MAEICEIVTVFKWRFVLTMDSTDKWSVDRCCRKEWSVVFNEALGTFYLRLYGVGRMEGMKCFYLMTHSAHFIYGYTVSDIWLRTILIARKDTRCRHIGLSFRLTARVLLYAPSHRQDSTYHTTAFVTPVVEHWLEWEIAQWVHPMKDRSDDPSKRIAHVVAATCFLSHYPCGPLLYARHYIISINIILLN